MALCVAVLFFLLPARGSRAPEPATSIRLADLGYQGVPNRYLLAGDSIFTVHFVDDTHLLATFTSRGLLTRLPDGEPQDQDQNVTAVLLELPTGRILAKTNWRMRDRGQYLWPVGHGRFILRIRTELTLINPLGHLAEGNAFAQEPFLDLHRKVGYIQVSPNADLVSVETVPLPKPKPVVSASASGAPAPAPHQPELRTADSQVQINFFRLIWELPPAQPEHLVLQSAGVVRAPNFIEIPATSDGYLDVSKESPGVFLFDFQMHGGKRLELSPIDTSCNPRPHFISRSEFIAFGCRGSDDRQEMAGFNLRGEETWINAFPNHHVFPYLAASPATGRFALSRTLLTGTYIDLDNLVPDQVSAQEVTVMQNYDGRPLLKLQATPFQRAGQNFDLSPNGLSLAIIHDESVQIYRLPPLTRKDEIALKAAEHDNPPPSQAIIDLGGKPVRRSGTPEEKTADNPPIGGKPSAANETAVSQTESSPAQGQAAQAQEPSQPHNGDLDPSVHRPPPSLYTKEYPKDSPDQAPPDPK